MVLLKGSNMALLGYIKMASVGGNPVTRASHVFDCGECNSWRTGGAKMVLLGGTKMVLLGGTKKKVLVATQQVLAALPHSWCSHWSNARAALLPNHPGQCP